MTPHGDWETRAPLAALRHLELYRTAPRNRSIESGGFTDKPYRISRVALPAATVSPSAAPRVGSVSSRAAFDPDVIRRVAACGHEIGYHYEDLHLSRGDKAAAYALFQSHLEMFRAIVPVSSICMHGSPTSRWNNLSLWDHYEYRSHGIHLEPYLDIDYTGALYLTDTGRSWAGRPGAY